MYKNLSFMSKILNINCINLLHMTKKVVKRSLFSLNSSDDNWKSNLIKEVIDCKEGFRFCDLNKLQLQEILDFLCIE